LPAVAITPEVAQRIVDYRTAHPFTSVDQLDEVKGIGAKTMGRVKDLVTV
jgi:competence protein ComEA